VVPMQKDNPKKGKRKKGNPKKDNPNKERFVGYGVEHMWTHKSGLERLGLISRDWRGFPILMTFAFHIT